MVSLFDYIYFRWFKVYSGHDKDPDIYATLMLTVYETLTIVNLVSIGSKTFNIDRPDGLFLIPLTFILGVLNYLHYKKIEFSTFEERWKEESDNTKRVRFFLLVFYLVAVFTAPWIYGFATN